MKTEEEKNHNREKILLSYKYLKSVAMRKYKVNQMLCIELMR